MRMFAKKSTLKDRVNKEEKQPQDDPVEEKETKFEHDPKKDKE
jgi:hypothetical protein